MELTAKKVRDRKSLKAAGSRTSVASGSVRTAINRHYRLIWGGPPSGITLYQVRPVPDSPTSVGSVNVRKANFEVIVVLISTLIDLPYMDDIWYVPI